MGCKNLCPRERCSQDPVSFGIIAAEEEIARGAFDPSAGNGRTNNIGKGLFSPKEILTGECSVWRINGYGLSIEQLRDRLFLEKEGLFAIVSVPANDIRSIKADDDDNRLFCVVDECDTDRVGGKHPAHAHIALCCTLELNDDEKMIMAQQARTELWKAFQNKEKWMLRLTHRPKS